MPEMKPASKARRGKRTHLKTGAFPGGQGKKKKGRKLVLATSPKTRRGEETPLFQLREVQKRHSIHKTGRKQKRRGFLRGSRGPL